MGVAGKGEEVFSSVGYDIHSRLLPQDVAGSAVMFMTHLVLLGP